MLTFKARVVNGRLVLDEATDLPEGHEVELVAVLADEEDHLDDDGRGALHATLAEANRDIEDDRLVDGERSYPS